MPESNIQLNSILAKLENKDFQSGFKNRAEVEGALNCLRQLFPETLSSYRPSGKASNTSVLLMFLSSPLIILSSVLLCFGIAWLEYKTIGQHSSDNLRITFAQGGIALFTNIWLALSVGGLPVAVISKIAKAKRNRNPKFQARLVGIIAFISSIIVFAPIWSGESIAPIDIYILGLIPIKWLLVILGCVVLPFYAAVTIFGWSEGQYYCEASGVFLEKHEEVFIPLEKIFVALEAINDLRINKFIEVSNLQKVRSLNCLNVILWYNPKAENGFLESEIHFYGSFIKEKNGSFDNESIERKWMVTSRELTQIEASEWKHKVF
jgi:hypothetical protein